MGVLTKHGGDKFLIHLCRRVLKADRAYRCTYIALALGIPGSNYRAETGHCVSPMRADNVWRAGTGREQWYFRTPEHENGGGYSAYRCLIHIAK